MLDLDRVKPQFAHLVLIFQIDIDQQIYLLLRRLITMLIDKIVDPRLGHARRCSRVV
ncbi:hypothetical protein D3C78_1792940 [compost metagenome]